ncbi:MAG: RecX family transcriptional regulator [Salinivirgaceae bacterium]|nr:RecX family transcriptional regulator [Salinivirgaceae bacterium]
MEREMTFGEALERCRFLAAKGECCTFDLEQKMRNWGVPSADIQRIITSLIDERYVDNLRFSIAYVRDKTRFNHWGRIKTRLMLWQKRIPQNTIDEAFTELPESDYQKAFEAERDKKMRQLRALKPFERNRKTAAYLIQKGFEPDVVFKNLNVDGEMD